MTYNSTTTLRRIRDAEPCPEVWTKLLAHLGKSGADDEPLDLVTVLDSNGLDDALWVLSYAMPDDRLARHFQAWCAALVLHLYEAEHPNDTRVRDQIAMLRNDDATDEARKAANVAARAAWITTCASAQDDWADAQDDWADAQDDWADAQDDWADAIVAARDARDAARVAWAEVLVAAIYARDVMDASWASARAAQEAQLRRMLES